MARRRGAGTGGANRSAGAYAGPALASQSSSVAALDLDTVSVTTTGDGMNGLWVQNGVITARNLTVAMGTPTAPPFSGFRTGFLETELTE